MKKAVMVVILIMVMAFGATAFAEIKAIGFAKGGTQKINGKKYFVPGAWYYCIDGYEFIGTQVDSQGLVVGLTQFLVKDKNGNAVPKTCDMGK
jgi:hypothetical protein